MNSSQLQTAGQGLWMVGCVAFAISAIRADDPFALVGSVLFAVGIVAFLITIRRGE